MMDPMTDTQALGWQGSLFDAPPAAGRAARALTFDRLARHQLDEKTWLDEVTAWVPDHGELFERMLAEAPWKQRERMMYDRMVLEPRMVAHWGDAAWHGDNNRKTLRDPLVATVSLGERRRFLLRPGTSGRPTHRFRPGGGDLLVMGGACISRFSGWWWSLCR